MDKKERYICFRNIIGIGVSLMEQVKKDVKEILREGAIDLAASSFGKNNYHFYSVGETLRPQKAYLGHNGNICVDACLSETKNKTFVLGWDDMCQDTITLSDFMDCIYGNTDLQYDTEMERNLQFAGGPCELLGQAKAVLDYLCESSADKADHQDIVNFFSEAAETARRWMDVKRLVNDEENPVDWDDAVETVWPVNTRKEKKEGNEHKQIADILPVYDGLRKELRELITKALVQDILAISPSGKLNVSDFNEYANLCDPANVYIVVNKDVEIQQEIVETISVTGDDIQIETKHGETYGRHILLEELRDIYNEVRFIAEKKDDPDWWFTVKDGAVIFKD